MNILDQVIAQAVARADYIWGSKKDSDWKLQQVLMKVEEAALADFLGDTGRAFKKLFVVGVSASTAGEFLRTLRSASLH